MEIFLVSAIWLFMGAACAYFAQIRGRDPIAWFVLGMLLGIIAFAVLMFLPSLDPSVAPKEEGEEELEEPLVVENNHLQEWFYMDDTHLQKGPISFFALQKLIDQGDLTRDSYVWSSGMSEWTAIKNLPDLMTSIPAR